MDDELPPSHVVGPLATYWNKPVRELVALPVVEFEPADRERHRIFSLLAMALVYRYWNGNKRGPDGEYSWRPLQRLSDGRYRLAMEEPRRSGRFSLARNTSSSDTKSATPSWITWG